MKSMKSKTGGNLEPMPFVRKWGTSDGGDGADAEQQQFTMIEDQGNGGAKERGSSKKHRHRSRSPSKKDRKHSSRSPEKKKHKKDKEGKHRKKSRSRSHERGSSKRAKAERSESSSQQPITAFPPPPDYMEQMRQRQQQQQTLPPLINLKQEPANDMQQQQYGQPQGFKQEWPKQEEYGQQQQYGQGQQFQAQPPAAEQQQKPTNDALSAALAAAAMVAQKLNKSHGAGGSIIGGPSIDLLNKLPQVPQRTTPIAEALLSKDSHVKKEPSAQEEGTDREKRRKSRWSTTKAFVPGMPTILPSDIDENQRQVYLLQMEVEETTRRLRQADFGQNLDPSERSPSPEPVYDAAGKRLNTREVRKRQELEQRRHEKIQALLRINPNYKPPADYRPPNIKLHDKVWIPQEEHPEINFVGLLIGPRGNTLKALEAETGAKIIIRGKGSVKEGKLANRTGPLPGENEPLHAYVTSTDREAIKRGCDKIREIINAALMIPDGQNELRKLQLRELALLNGTLRPEDVLSGARCANCGSDQHKTWECMEAPNITASVICTACGGAGHIARDCKNPRPGFDLAMMDSEYTALMAELGEKPPISMGAGTAPAPMGGAPRPGFQTPAGGPMRPRFPLGSPTPIVRVNLARPQGGYPGWADGGAANNFYGFSGLPGQDPAAAAAAWVAWQQSNFPAPVPPPPEGNGDQAAAGTSSGAAAVGSGLAMFPPPPPPPPPVPKVKDEFGGILSAPPPPN